MIVDLMGIVYSASSSNCNNFGDICVKLYNNIKSYLDVADILVIVPNRYDIEDSIKVFERKRRNLSPTPERIIHNEFTPLPTNVKQFLSNQINKANFVKFLLNQLVIWFSEDFSDSK